MTLIAPNRLLPATAAAIILVTLFKLGALINNVPSVHDLQTEAANTGSSMLPQAQAAGLPPNNAQGNNAQGQQAAGQSPANGASPAKANPMAMASAAPSPALAGPAGGTGSIPPAPGSAGAANDMAPLPPSADAASSVPTVPFVAPSDADKALLEDLRSRRSTIEGKEQGLAQREATVAAAEKRLTDRVAELVSLQTRLQGLTKNLKARDEANWQGLVKMYEVMRPQDAASIFNALDRSVLVEVLDRMKPTKAALVLAAMDAEKARQVTADLATKRTQTTTLSN